MNKLHLTAKFDKYKKMLIEWNQKFNLTSITDEIEIEQKHFIDSLAAAEYIKSGDEVLDIGSGAGFPGLVLAIVREDASFTLIDSVNKKVTFLNAVISELGLKNVRALHARIEDIKEKESYDVVTSRAVAELRTLSEYALPFVKSDGAFIAYKSEKTDEEISNAANSLKTLSGEVSEIVDVSRNGNVRKLIIIKKRGKTPEKYPRGKNLPRIKPL